MGPDSTHKVTRSCNGLKSRGPNFLWGLVLLLSLYLHTSEFLVFLPRLDINEEKGKSWIKKFCRRVSPLSRRMHCTRLFFAADDMLEVASCCIWRNLALAPSVRIFLSLNLQSLPQWRSSGHNGAFHGGNSLHYIVGRGGPGGGEGGLGQANNTNRY